jgi:hypothetical protein
MDTLNTALAVLYIPVAMFLLGVVVTELEYGHEKARWVIAVRVAFCVFWPVVFFATAVALVVGLIYYFIVRSY